MSTIRNKVLAVALMCVAAIAMLAAPAVLNGYEPAAESSSQQTTADSPAVSDADITVPDKEPVTVQTTAAAATAPTVSDETSVQTTAAVQSVQTVSELTSPEKTTAPAESKTTAKVKETSVTKKKTTAVTTAVSSEKKDPPAASTTTAKPASPPASSGTPVAQHGQLSVRGANIVDKNGNNFQLIGMSTHGLGWFPDAVSEQNFKVLRDDWGCNAVRLAMYIEESWGGSESLYLAQPDKNYKLVEKGVDACIDLGMYVIVDWHVLNPGDPTTHTEDAKKFFAKLAKEYGDCPNIIYEICNEPNSGTDWNKIKKYAEQVIPEIRKYDKDAIIICGTPTWSQEIDKAKASPLSDKNTVYALHFYANTHKDDLRNRLKSCYNSGLPVVVSEFGTCDASGNSGFNASETTKWVNLLNELDVGMFNWSLCNKNETASAIRSDVSLSAFKAGEQQLTESGKLIRKLFRKRAGLD